MLLLNDVTKKYGNFVALENINLEFENGVYGLLAPNGAGKTTLIKMITTLLFPTKGEILYKGDNINKLGESYREIIGYLPQQFGYYKDYTPRKYLFYLSALKGIEKSEAKKRTEDLLKEVYLEDVMDKKMKKFSGGMIQRVGIAQAMLNNPKVLVLDEPTAGLDPKERVRFRNIISSLSKDKIVILSTHIVSDIETIANKIIMIKDKKIFKNETRSNIIKVLGGKVFETNVAEEDMENFKNKYFILSTRQEYENTMVRFVADSNIEDNFKPVIPNLEDIFLYIYRED